MHRKLGYQVDLSKLQLFRRRLGIGIFDGLCSDLTTDAILEDWALRFKSPIRLTLRDTCSRFLCILKQRL